MGWLPVVVVVCGGLLIYFYYGLIAGYLGAITRFIVYDLALLWLGATIYFLLTTLRRSPRR